MNDMHVSVRFWKQMCDTNLQLLTMNIAVNKNSVVKKQTSQEENDEFNSFILF